MIRQHGTLGGHGVCAQREGEGELSGGVVPAGRHGAGAPLCFAPAHSLQLEPELRHGACVHAADKCQSDGAVDASIGVAHAEGKLGQCCDLSLLRHGTIACEVDEVDEGTRLSMC
jgi:hypothetical protein